jgi:hypothetical protein
MPQNIERVACQNTVPTTTTTAPDITTNPPFPPPPVVVSEDDTSDLVPEHKEEAEPILVRQRRSGEFP